MGNMSSLVSKRVPMAKQRSHNHEITRDNQAARYHEAISSSFTQTVGHLVALLPSMVAAVNNCLKHAFLPKGAAAGL